MAGGITQPTERQVQRQILAMLGACFPEVLAHHSPNGAHLAGSSVQRFKQMGALLGDGVKKGWPDLIVLWRGGGALLEVKRPKTGRLSDEQKALHARLEAIGWPVATVTSAIDAHAFLKGCGAPCRGDM